MPGSHRTIFKQDHGGEVSTPHRVLTGWHHVLVLVVGVCLSLFHLWSNTLGVLPELQRNAAHYAFILFLGYLLYPLSARYASRTLILDYIFAILSFAVALYLVFFEDALHARNEVPNTTDLIFAGIAILLLLEITCSRLLF